EYYQRVRSDIATDVRDTRARAGIRPREVYRIRHDQGYFETGTASGDRMVILGLFGEPLAIFFDRDGNLVAAETRLLTIEPEYHPKTGRALPTPEWEAAADAAMAACKAEIDFRAEPIRVHRFTVPELGIGIEDRPSYFEEF